MKYSYGVECPCLGSWNQFIKHSSLGYCQGYIDAMKGQLPRVHLRLFRSDGKIIDEALPNDDVGIGMIAGWPTAEQYERSAEKALERAAKIRINQARKDNK